MSTENIMVRFQYHPASQMARMPSQVFKATDTADNMPVIMPRQHAKFYMKNVPIGDQVVFQVENSLYLLSKFVLGRSSKFFLDVLGLPQGEENALEGTCDSHPIIVPGVDEVSFDFFLEHIFGTYNPNPTVEDLLASLECSLRWTVPNLRLYAIHHLYPLIREGRVHQGTVLGIARRHGIPAWISSAVRGLRKQPLETWSTQPQVVSWLTAEPMVLITVAMVREKISLRRSALASKIPDAVQSPTCKNHQGCTMAWEITWLMKVAPKLIDPDDLWRVSIRDVQDIVLRLEIPDMHSDCFVLSIDPLRSSKAWDFEEVLVQKAIDTLMVEETDLGFAAGDESGLN